MDKPIDDDILERECGDVKVATSLSAVGRDDGRNESAYLRAENEDDDGYDPYSDRRYEAPLFEPDPWN